ncbi:MAG: type II toxin-antitoxin system HicA family toxin [Deltaproteobacteria bacterium]|nr:type II toxin-antitoxin system HicA family toxin [Deltaproteobacteria bacterium]
MIHLLKNTPVRDLVRALELDGFEYRRRKGSQRVYRHSPIRRHRPLCPPQNHFPFSRNRPNLFVYDSVPPSVEFPKAVAASLRRNRIPYLRNSGLVKDVLLQTRR